MLSQTHYKPLTKEISVRIDKSFNLNVISS